uniref:HVA22-like protein n=2 Tax=Lactuca sativa TaxID=4236 RepID=A0A9R1W7T4_LACSA|nr:hypothetical protein LSAT_V11C200054250 [Lactuca sativa]
MALAYVYKMIGSFLTRGLVMVFGYAYPAYECFKAVERNKPDIEQLRFWCQYWILVAVLTVCERIGDTFVSWVPMYSEAKLAFYIYLWYPKTKGTIYVYDSFFRPYISKHETDIDRNLMELRTRAGDIVVLYWQRAATYGQTRIFDVLQYVASQSTPKPQPPQPARPRQPPQNRRPPPPSQQEPKEPPSPSSTSSSSSFDSSPQQDNPTTNHRPQPPPAAVISKAQKASSSQSVAVVAPPDAADDMEVVETESNPNPNTSVKEIVMEEPTRVYTRARSRKNNSVVNVE